MPHTFFGAHIHAKSCGSCILALLKRCALRRSTFTGSLGWLPKSTQSEKRLSAPLSRLRWPARSRGGHAAHPSARLPARWWSWATLCELPATDELRYPLSGRRGAGLTEQIQAARHPSLAPRRPRAGGHCARPLPRFRPAADAQGRGASTEPLAAAVPAR